MKKTLITLFEYAIGTFSRTLSQNALVAFIGKLPPPSDNQSINQTVAGLSWVTGFGHEYWNQEL